MDNIYLDTKVYAANINSEIVNSKVKYVLPEMMLSRNAIYVVRILSLLLVFEKHNSCQNHKQGLFTTSVNCWQGFNIKLPLLMVP